MYIQGRSHRIIICRENRTLSVFHPFSGRHRGHGRPAGVILFRLINELTAGINKMITRDPDDIHRHQEFLVRYSLIVYIDAVFAVMIYDGPSHRSIHKRRVLPGNTLICKLPASLSSYCE